MIAYLFFIRGDNLSQPGGPVLPYCIQFFINLIWVHNLNFLVSSSHLGSLKSVFFLQTLWLLPRASIIFSYATPATLLYAYLFQASQQWILWVSVLSPTHLFCHHYYPLAVKTEKRPIRLDTNKQRSGTWFVYLSASWTLFWGLPGTSRQQGHI